MRTWLVGLELLLPLLVVWLDRARPGGVRPERVVAVPALLAPLALLYPWAVVPDHLGVALAGPSFFLHWLTQHPNLGPVNVEVLLGMGAVLAAALVPPVLAVYRLKGGGHRGWTAGLAATSLAAYAAVLVRLDLDLYRVGLWGAPTLLGRVVVYEALGGPMVRGLGALAVLLLGALAMRRRRARAETVVLEQPGAQ